MKQHQADAIAAFLKRATECIQDADALLRASIKETEPNPPTNAGNHLKLVTPNEEKPE